MRSILVLKALFLLVNHYVAAQVPPSLLLPTDWVSGGVSLPGLYARSTQEYDPGHFAFTSLESRAASCDRRARCKKKQIRNPADNTMCIRCPPGMRADFTKTICMRDSKDPENDKRKQDQRSKLMEKLNERLKQRLDKMKEEKKLKDRIKDAQVQGEKRDKKKVRRMGVCLPLVAAATGVAGLYELASDGFSEDLFEPITSDVLGLWHGDIKFEDTDKLPDDENALNDGGFVDSYMSVGDENSGPAKRDGLANSVISMLMIRGKDINAAGSSPSQQAHGQLEKRFLKSLLKLFKGGKPPSGPKPDPVKPAQPLGKVKDYYKNHPLRRAKPGQSKLNKAQQMDKAKEVIKNKNWKNCLSGKKAEK